MHIPKPISSILKFKTIRNKKVWICLKAQLRSYFIFQPIIGVIEVILKQS